MALSINVLPVGILQANCIILSSIATKSLMIVDPGGDAPKILDKIKKITGKTDNNFDFDHSDALSAMKKATNGKVWVHKDDMPLYKQLRVQPGMFGLPAMRDPPTFDPDCYIEDGKPVTAGSIEAIAYHTPGHTPGSCSFYLAESKVVLTGDTLFEGSAGRTDFPGGSSKAITNSIRNKLYTLPDDTRVICGHGDETTIGNEKKYNMVVRP